MNLSPLWSYHFVSLTQPQIETRRELLDLRGTIAQASALVALICVSIYGRMGASNSSAGSSKERTERSWLDSAPVNGWRETKRQYLAMLVWMVWIMGLSVWKTGDDYLHLTKSVAHTAIATIPIQILVSPKLASRNSPILHLLGLPQSVLRPYHRLYGRLILFPLLISHAILYTTFFIRKSLFSKRINDTDVQWGATGVILVLGLWSLGSGTKHLKRKYFYLTHVTMVLGLLGIIFFHVVYVRKYVLEAIGLYIFDLCCYAVEKFGTKQRKALNFIGKKDRG